MQINKDNEIPALKTILELRDRELERLQKDVDELSSELDNEIDEYESKIEELEADINELEKQIGILEEELKDNQEYESYGQLIYNALIDPNKNFDDVVSLLKDLYPEKTNMFYTERELKNLGRI